MQSLNLTSIKFHRSKSNHFHSKIKYLHQNRALCFTMIPATLLLPTRFVPPSKQSTLFSHTTRNNKKKKNQSILLPVSRLFGPAIFEASKLKVLFLGVDEKKHPGKLPRTYTLTHSDVTSKLTLAISQTINNSQFQGWYNKLQRDEVVAEWKRVKEKMSLHVHVHISGGHFLLDLVARLRYFIFCRELPVVVKAFVHGDGNLLNNYPDLQEALVWVYFHSNIHEFNRVECWGSFKDAAHPSSTESDDHGVISWDMPHPCIEDCSCCFPSTSLIPWSHSLSVQDASNSIINADHTN